MIKVKWGPSNSVSSLKGEIKTVTLEVCLGRGITYMKMYQEGCHLQAKEEASGETKPAFIFDL